MNKVIISYRPLTQWPAGRPRTPNDERRRSTFRAAVSATFDELDRELWTIGVTEAVVQVDITSERDLRHDGQIRSDARVKSPAVVLSFARDTTPLIFAGDYFTEWDDNLRAIALGLEGLRRLERYHIGQSGDQYRGWQALPSVTTPAFNLEQAAALLERLSAAGISAADIATNVAAARHAYRRAAANTHPDGGGSTGNFQLVQEAKRVLQAHHGATL